MEKGVTKYKLSFGIPFWDELAVVHFFEMLIHASYEKQFWRSIAPPHRIVYIFSHLSEDGVKNWKSRIREHMMKYDLDERMLKGMEFTVEEI